MQENIPAFVHQSVSKYIRHWRLLPASFPEIHMPSPSDEAEKAVDQLFTNIKNRRFNKEGNGKIISGIFAMLFKASPAEKLSENFITATFSFVDKALAFNPRMPLAEIYQAIRNMWIANSIQYIFGEEINLSPSIFAYSMLYPYSDNLLDDKNLTGRDKEEFNLRFKSRLLGRNIAPGITLEADIYRLVEMIEDQYDRNTNAAVYESLLAIHKSQHKSISLSAGCDQDPENTLWITFEKGGTSVLADGFLVKNPLKRTEADFLMGFGIFLQLLDDLQDIKEDLNQHQTTIFSHRAGRKPLDKEAAKTIRLMQSVLLHALRSFPDKKNMLDTIEKSCATLIFRSVFNHKEYFSQSFLTRCEKASPYQEAYFRSKKAKMALLSRKDLYLFIKNTLDTERMGRYETPLF